MTLECTEKESHEKKVEKEFEVPAVACTTLPAPPDGCTPPVGVPEGSCTLSQVPNGMCTAGVPEMTEKEEQLEFLDSVQVRFPEKNEDFFATVLATFENDDMVTILPDNSNDKYIIPITWCTKIKKNIRYGAAVFDKPLKGALVVSGPDHKMMYKYKLGVVVESTVDDPHAVPEGSCTLPRVPPQTSNIIGHMVLWDTEEKPKQYCFHRGFCTLKFPPKPISMKK
jgi:hypothetical protein